MKNITIDDYPFIIKHLSEDDGGGYLIEYPDLPGCMSDGESYEEAIKNGKDAAEGWIETAKEIGRAIPIPNQLKDLSGKWVQRVPKSIHLRLINKAKEEGVSLNTLVITLLSECLSTNNDSNKESIKKKKSISLM